jgi:GNAT superfamily N-acetyltransferase
MRVTVRRVRAHEVEVLKSNRLAALRDTPSAFGSTYADEVVRTDAEWADRAGLGSEGSERATFFAEIDGAVVGLVGGHRAEPGQSVVNLVSMWTSPAARRTGVGRALVGAVVEWARATGASNVELWVTRGNDPAQRLYASCGFEVTGDVQPLPSDPCRHELRMRLVL